MKSLNFNFRRNTKIALNILSKISQPKIIFVCGNKQYLLFIHIYKRSKEISEKCVILGIELSKLYVKKFSPSKFWIKKFKNVFGIKIKLYDL